MIVFSPNEQARVRERIQLEAYLRDRHDYREVFDALRRQEIPAELLPLVADRLLTLSLDQRELESLYFGVRSDERLEAKVAIRLQLEYPQSLIAKVHRAVQMNADEGDFQACLATIGGVDDFSALLEISGLFPSHRAMSYAIARRMLLLEPNAVLPRLALLLTMSLLSEPGDSVKSAMEARAIYNTLVRLQPDTIDGRIYMITILQPRRDRDEILTLAKEALAIDPTCPEALSSSATTLCLTDGSAAASAFVAEHDGVLSQLGVGADERRALLQPALYAIEVHDRPYPSRERGWPSMWP